MNRFKNILAVCEQTISDSVVLERAIALAQKNGARLTVAEAVPSLPSDIAESVLRVSPQELIERFTLESHRRLIKQIPCTTGGTMHLTVAVLVGTPFVEIIRAVLRNKHDLVMMGAEGNLGLRARFFGSTALHVMRKCPCPVWIMKPVHRMAFAGILAAVDPDPTNEAKHALNIKIMDLATSLAREEQCKLHVVHIWSPWREHFLRYAKMSARRVEQVTQELLAQRRTELDALVGEYSLEDLDSQVHFLLDEPGLAIPKLAARRHIELIVMGTVCRTGLPGLFIGSTAENVLSQVDCSVLALKPEGFVSPVQHKDT
jgi:nucleotide-binding universal stress UspA family protein